MMLALFSWQREKIEEWGKYLRGTLAIGSLSKYRDCVS
jgi:hypothetical protein